MKNKLAITFCIFTVVFGFDLNAYSAPADEAPDGMAQIAASSFICKFNNIALPENVPAFTQEIVAQPGVSLRHKFDNVLKGFSAMMSAAAAENFQVHNPNIVHLIRWLQPVVKKHLLAGRVVKVASPDKFNHN